jgi:CheY-like chemotaxis protein
MVGDIAHNFNNILNIIIGNAQLAKMSEHCAGDVPVYLSSIEDEVFRAADMVEQLLTFGRRKQLDMKILDINDIVRDFVKIIHEIIGENIETRVVFASKPSKVKIDIARINQVLLNLVMNARDAMSEKRALTIEIHTDEITGMQRRLYLDAIPGKYVVLSVSDTGAGIDEKTMKKLFEPLFTTDPSGEKKGLGLSVVYGVVKQHGGLIDVLSEAGIGATFRVYLPSATERKKPKKLEEKVIKGGSEAILIAEDEPALRDIAANILKNLGYRIFLAADGMEALDIFRKNSHEIDMVLLDVVMPGLNGREAYREMKKIKTGIPVLFVTGYSLDGIQTNFIFEERFDVIQKPFTLVSLGKKIREVLDWKDSENQNID